MHIINGNAGCLDMIQTIQEYAQIKHRLTKLLLPTFHTVKFSFFHVS